jgi:hypothetical protein
VISGGDGPVGDDLIGGGDGPVSDDLIGGWQPRQF